MDSVPVPAVLSLTVIVGNAMPAVSAVRMTVEPETVAVNWECSPMVVPPPDGDEAAVVSVNAPDSQASLIDVATCAVVVSVPIVTVKSLPLIVTVPVSFVAQVLATVIVHLSLMATAPPTNVLVAMMHLRYDHAVGVDVRAKSGQKSLIG